MKFTPSQVRAWLSQDFDKDANQEAFEELCGLINGTPLSETINSLQAFLDNQDD